MIYKVSEIFFSIQGEGLLQGIPIIFLRFSGCNLRCWWCDTKYAWETGSFLDLDKIIKEIEIFKCKRICFTGGEPYLQEIEILFDILKKRSYWISVETNGTIWKDIKFDWITISPKIEGKKYFPSGYDERFKEIANEFKYVILNDESFDFIDRKIKKPVILQPLNNDPIITKKIIEFLKKNHNRNWYLRLQLHKILNIK